MNAQPDGGGDRLSKINLNFFVVVIDFFVGIDERKNTERENHIITHTYHTIC